MGQFQFLQSPIQTATLNALDLDLSIIQFTERVEFVRDLSLIGIIVFVQYQTFFGQVKWCLMERTHLMRELISVSVFFHIIKRGLASFLGEEHTLHIAKLTAYPRK